MGPKTRGKKGDEPLDESRGPLNNLEDAVGLPRKTIPDNVYGVYSEEIGNILEALEIFPNMRTVFRDRLEGIAHFQHFINREKEDGRKVKEFVNVSRDDLKNDLTRDVNLIKKKKSQDLLKRMAEEKIPQQFHMTYLYQTLLPENKSKSADKFYDEVIADDASLGSLSRFTPSRTKISTPSTSGSKISGLTVQSTPGARSANSFGQETFPGMGSSRGTIATRLSAPKTVLDHDAIDRAMFSGFSQDTNSLARRLIEGFEQEDAQERGEVEEILRGALEGRLREEERGEVEGRLREAIEEIEETQLREAEAARARRNTNLTPGPVVRFNEPETIDLTDQQMEAIQDQQQYDQQQYDEIDIANDPDLQPFPKDRNLQRKLKKYDADIKKRKQADLLTGKASIQAPTTYDEPTEGQRSTGVASINPDVTFRTPTDAEQAMASSSSEQPETKKRKKSDNKKSEPRKGTRQRTQTDRSEIPQGPQLQSAEQKQKQGKKKKLEEMRKIVKVPKGQDVTQNMIKEAFKSEPAKKASEGPSNIPPLIDEATQKKLQRENMKKTDDRFKETERYEHPELPMTPDEKKAYEFLVRLGKGGHAEMSTKYPDKYRKIESYRQRVRYNIKEGKIKDIKKR